MSGLICAMDAALVFLMVAVCMYGSHKNDANLPPLFQGNFAEAVVEHKITKKAVLPYYTEAYGNMGSGKIEG